MSGSALAIEDLKVYYWPERGPITAVEGGCRCGRCGPTGPVGGGTRTRVG